jgi:hypothetical protein
MYFQEQANFTVIGDVRKLEEYIYSYKFYTQNKLFLFLKIRLFGYKFRLV